MKAAVFSADQWLYPDTSTDQRSDQIALAVARGARCACQVLVQAPDAAKLSFSLDGDVPGAPQTCQLVDVMVERNTGLHGFVTKPGDDPSDYVTRAAPFRVYDALKPTGGSCELKNGQAALHLLWRIPTDAEPGSYQTTLRLGAGSTVAEIPIEIQVHAARVPVQGNLKVTNWFSLENMASRHGLDLWSPEHWQMIERYAKIMRDGRQTHFLLPIRLVEIEQLADGDYRFDFSRVERLANLFFDLGFTCLEGGHVGSRLHWSAPEFVLAANREIEATAPEGYRFLAQYLPAWRQFLVDHGWLDRCLQYVADEPTDTSAADYRVLSGIVRKFLPGIRLIDAVERPELGGAVDIWVPKNSYYEQHRDAFEAHRALGDELWFYTCCIPGGHYCNRLLDAALLRTRYLHWGNHLYDLKGYLHWGLNHYKATQDPFEENAPAHGEGGTTNLPPGDTHIVYPGTDGPWGSVRLQAMAMGIEDYELFQQLDPETGRAICQRCLPAFDQPNEDLQAFDRAHEDLLITASRG
ncbi:MAG: DUF4091 domain-containing protein [Victivallales bacterium]|nr:DUF4091 domain-containing protein [Victivallales bacterium]